MLLFGIWYQYKAKLSMFIHIYNMHILIKIPQIFLTNELKKPLISIIPII